MAVERQASALLRIAGFRSKARAARRKRSRWLSDYRKFLRKEFRWQVGPLQRRPLWWRRGFLSRSVTLYELDRNDPKLYVNDVQRYTRTKYMVHETLQEILDNKFAFFLLMNQLGLKSEVVPLLGLYVRGGVHAFPNDDRLPLKDFLATRLETDAVVFVKPLRGAEGRFVRSIAKTGEGYVMNGQPTTLMEIRRWVEGRRRPMIFERGVQQHEFQARLNPSTVNTLRVLTMPDVAEGKDPFIAAAVHRIGTNLSGHVDNWTQGGLSAAIDIETGRLGSAAQLPNDRRPVWHDSHPDTGAQILGEQVPYWAETRELVMEAARRLHFMEYIGWDIIISPTGPVILEANINTGLNVIQVHGPLLADPRVRRYYEKRGAI